MKPEGSLGDGVVDVAIDWLPVELDPFMNGKLFDDRLVLLVRRGHPLVDVDVTIEDLLKAEFVTLHHRREIEHAPAAIREFRKLGMRETVHVSELLEIPTVVASTGSGPLRGRVPEGQRQARLSRHVRMVMAPGRAPYDL
jgi:DNA-binding transcriptional LysR family regulator